MLYPVISSRGDLVSASFKHVYNFLIKSKRKSLKSNSIILRIELPKRRVNLNYTLSNRYNGADLMFLSLLIKLYIVTSSIFLKNCKHVWLTLKSRSPRLMITAYTISFIIFWDFSMFYQIFLTPQVKGWAIITYKHGIYELPHNLPNDLRLRKLGNIRRVSKLHRMIA